MMLIQYSEVDRAIDNLSKSGKMFGVPGRRDSLPMGGPPARSEFQGQYGEHTLNPYALPG
jgi:hypothetical protein